RPRTARTRRMVPRARVRDSGANPVPARLMPLTKASGPTSSRTHQPWTSSRLASIVLLKISAVRPNRKTTSRVSRRFVPTTAGSIGPGPPTKLARAGTNGFPLGDGEGVATTAIGGDDGGGAKVSLRTPPVGAADGVAGVGGGALGCAVGGGARGVER